MHSVLLLATITATDLLSLDRVAEAALPSVDRLVSDAAADLLSFDLVGNYTPPRLQLLWIEDSTHHYCLQWSYYCDIKRALSRYHDICTPTESRTPCLGPESSFVPDMAIVGPHYASNVYTPEATLGFDRSLYPNLPLVIFQNKMYAWGHELAGEVQAKLDWARITGAVAAFTFLTRYREFSTRSGVPHYWMPFGVDTKLYGKFAGRFGPEAQPFDVGFTGASSSKYPLREGILRTVKGMNVSSYLGTWSQTSLNRADSRSWKTLGRDDYARQLARTKIWISTTGPEGIVGTRFYEVLASGTTLLLANRPSAAAAAAAAAAGRPAAYAGLFEDGVHAVLFDGLDDMRAQIWRYLRDDKARQRIVRAAAALARARHSWDSRARFVTQAAMHAIGRHDPHRPYYVAPISPPRAARSNTTFVGCFDRSDLPRGSYALKPRTRLGHFTVASCEAQCRARNHSSFGVVGGGFANGMAHRLAKCQCGDGPVGASARALPRVTCDYPCLLHDLRPCGGPAAFAVYHILREGRRGRRRGRHNATLLAGGGQQPRDARRRERVGGGAKGGKLH